MIIFEHVTKRYPGGTVAVDDLGLEVPDGKIMILVGPSGYGKATTLRMGPRLVEPTGVRSSPIPGLVLLLCVRREALFDHMEVRDRPSACCRSSGLELEAA